MSSEKIRTQKDNYFVDNGYASIIQNFSSLKYEHCFLKENV